MLHLLKFKNQELSFDVDKEIVKRLVCCFLIHCALLMDFETRIVILGINIVALQNTHQILHKWHKPIPIWNVYIALQGIKCKS